MKKLFSWRPWSRKSELDMETLVKLENYLDETLVPVKPNTAFISGLHGRLLTAPEPQLPSMPPALQYTILGVLGLFSGIIIITTGIRATITILGALGILSQLKKRSAPV